MACAYPLSRMPFTNLLSYPSSLLFILQISIQLWLSRKSISWSLQRVSDATVWFCFITLLICPVTCLISCLCLSFSVDSWMAGILSCISELLGLIQCLQHTRYSLKDCLIIVWKEIGDSSWMNCWLQWYMRKALQVIWILFELISVQSWIAQPLTVY